MIHPRSIFIKDNIIYLANQNTVNNFYLMNTIAIINPETPQEIINNLEKHDFETVKIDKTELVSEYLAGHPDIQIFPFNGTIFCHPDISADFLKKIGNYADIRICSTKLTHNYPNDISYNILHIPGFAMHKIKHTEPEIKMHLEKESVRLLNVNQGYTKCSGIPLSGSVITADETIYKKCKEYKIRSLKISSGYVNLPGCKYGFLGGASGVFKNRLYLTGNLKNHPDRLNIEKFAESENFDIFYLSETDPVDLGSIFFI